jgi:uncharacterized protein YabN with tetrapyrrole methylase and pyrophosphatase domain
VFGDATAGSPEEVAADWEARKLVEKSRSSVTEGIPAALPALALAAKLQRKALAVGMVLPEGADQAARVVDGVSSLMEINGTSGRVADGEGGRTDQAAEIGELLFALVNLARTLGIDPESALRARASRFRLAVEERG